MITVVRDCESSHLLLGMAIHSPCEDQHIHRMVLSISAKLFHRMLWRLPLLRSTSHVLLSACLAHSSLSLFLNRLMVRTHASRHPTSWQLQPSVFPQFEKSCHCHVRKQWSPTSALCVSFHRARCHIVISSLPKKTMYLSFATQTDFDHCQPIGTVRHFNNLLLRQYGFDTFIAIAKMHQLADDNNATSRVLLQNLLVGSK